MIEITFVKQDQVTKEIKTALAKIYQLPVLENTFVSFVGINAIGKDPLPSKTKVKRITAVSLRIETDKPLLEQKSKAKETLQKIIHQGKVTRFYTYFGRDVCHVIE